MSPQLSQEAAAVWNKWKQAAAATAATRVLQ